MVENHLMAWLMGGSWNVSSCGVGFVIMHGTSITRMEWGVVMVALNHKVQVQSTMHLSM